MEIRDIIHGAVRVEPWEIGILDSRYFQRLRQIRQVGFAENSFPAATHNRYIHSLGAMQTATTAFQTIFDRGMKEATTRFYPVIRFAGLLHDIGHGPLSHTTESAMPPLKELKLPACISTKGKPKRATHEDYTLKMILDSGLTPLLEKAGKSHGFKPIHIAALIDSRIETQDDFFIEKIRPGNPHAGEVCDFRPILSQLISSELDADRMDYLRRDSLHAGVSYGQFDFDWLVSNLTYRIQAKKVYLSLHHRALYTFEDFLISRFHMFLMVYFHHKSVVFDEMLAKYLGSPDCDYILPSDIEAYCEFHDAHLYAHLAKSTNPWAKRITQRQPYRMLVELHSGIPATHTARQEQERLLAKIKHDLKNLSIQFLEATSTSELSKYFRRPGYPIFVRYDNHYSSPSFIPLEQCTDLFEKYSEKRFITRLYISPEDYPRFRSRGRGTPLRYEKLAPDSADKNLI